MTPRQNVIMIMRSNILLRVLRFAKPECDNVLQPKPPIGEGCNTLSQEGSANINIRKGMLYLHCYIPSFQAQAVPNKMSTVAS